MELKILDINFTVCKIRDLSQVRTEDPFFFIGRTDEELSLVCPSASAPEDSREREDGWRAFRIQGTLDFSLIGILAGISGILAEHRIGIFVASTYQTDYVLVKEENLKPAKLALEDAGYKFV